MRRSDKTALAVALSAILLILGTGIATRFARPEAPPPAPKPERIRAVLELAPLADTSKALVVGYNYELLKRYAASNGQTAEIRLTGRDRSFLDSLRAGVVDIVVVPFEDSLAVDSVLVSAPVDSLSLWLMRHDEHDALRELNGWIAAWHASPDYPAVRSAFLDRFSAFKSGPRPQISPYDSLIRAHADSLGWDWHLLAAVIYQESRFHIEAVSPRGAAGLMQMMPRTAANYGVTDPLDPEMNVAAGAQLLGNLIKRYYPVGDNMTERYKYALAAYNAGVGRIDDCLAMARHLGVDTGYWINIVNRVLPVMAQEDVAQTGVVRLGPFKGAETTFYVDNTIAVYNRFCKITP
ncbi:MAG: transglycosylase SLT domain-containing protein [Bacteroidales bacterium]|nr:transglycosylase SLT domain-containing protein [Bacteroidales bacterium]